MDITHLDLAGSCRLPWVLLMQEFTLTHQTPAPHQ